jgi:hypothetical protein
VIQLLKLVRGDFGTSIVREERHGPAAAKFAGAGLCRLASAGPFRGIRQPAVPGALDSLVFPIMAAQMRLAEEILQNVCNVLVLGPSHGDDEYN